MLERPTMVPRRVTSLDRDFKGGGKTGDGGRASRSPSATRSVGSYCACSAAELEISDVAACSSSCSSSTACPNDP